MSYLQVSFLAFIACYAFTIITGMTGLIIYKFSLGSSPFMPTQALPTLPVEQPSRTPILTTTLQPTFTKRPTATIFPTKTITPTSTLWFQANVRDLIPTEREMPSGYKIDTGGSGSISGNSIIENYMVTYTNNFPNDPRNNSGDPYLVVYIATIFYTVNSASSSYDAMDESWVSDNFGNMFDISSTPQSISPSSVALNINGIERATAYISEFNGISVPGFFVYIKLQNNNGVFIVRTLSHAPFTNEQRALSSARYFASLFAPKIIR